MNLNYKFHDDFVTSPLANEYFVLGFFSVCATVKRKRRRSMMNLSHQDRAKFLNFFSLLTVV